MVALLIIAAISVVLLCLWPIAIGGAPYVPTPPDVIRHALRLAQVQPGETVVDLGCGDGRVLRLAAQEFGAVGVGIEVNPLWVWWARWRCRGLPVTVQWGRLEQADLSGADVVYLFLAPAVWPRLTSRLAGLRPAVRLVSYGFALPNRVAQVEAGNCYLYRRA